MTKIKRNLEEYKAKREQLVKLSNLAKIERQKSGHDELSLNFFIVEFYRLKQPGQYETFQEWKRQGKMVKKGEKGFPIWGKPLSAQTKKNGEPVAEPTEKEADFFPICYLFHESQVSDFGERSEEVNEEKEEKTEEVLHIPTRSTFTHQKVGSC